MGKSLEKRSLVDKINLTLKRLAIVTGIAGTLLGTAELTGCRPNNKEDLKNFENTTKSKSPDSLAYNPDSPDSTDYTMFEQDVKNADSVSKIVDQDLQQSIKELKAELQKLKDAQAQGQQLDKEIAQQEQRIQKLQNQYNQMLNNQN